MGKTVLRKRNYARDDESSGLSDYEMSLKRVRLDRKVKVPFVENPYHK
jgi:hypothetical protein